MKLHLGCGKRILPGYVNVDADPSADLVHDVKNFEGVYDDNSIDEIYISHTLEHFSRREVLPVLKEYNRILKIGGTLRISVPDFDAIVDLYKKDKSNIYNVMGLLYGGQKNNLDYHKIIYTIDTLTEILTCMGFSNVTKYDPFEFLGDDKDDYSKCTIPHMDKKGKLMSLCVTCKKVTNKIQQANENVTKLLKIPTIYRPSIGGIGNLFIHLTQCETVSDTIYNGNRDKYFILDGLNIIKDEEFMPEQKTSIFIGQPIHHRIRDILKPTDHMKTLIKQHEHIVKDVKFAIQIRRSGLARSMDNLKEPAKELNYCTDETLNKFMYIVENTTGNVFVTSDCYEIKKMFLQKWPNRVRILDEPSVHTSSSVESDPRVPILEFFLLSMCPLIYGTGGDQNTGMSMSTYGYMAAIYGNKKFTFIFN